MLSLTLVSASALLLGTVVVGVIAHELSHVLALRMAGITCTVEFLPERKGSGQFWTGIGGSLARVTPTGVPTGCSPWQIRLAAMMPLCLLAPFALVALGVLPSPFALDSVALELAVIAWVGCSLPSPRDFSILWYPREAMAAHARPNHSPK